MPPKQPTLTPAQRRWIEEYLVDSNGRAAAMRAGCSSKAAQGMATRYLANPAVMAHVAACQRALLASRNMSRQAVSRGLQQAFDIAQQLGDSAAMLSAARELAQIHNYGPADEADNIASGQDVSVHKLHKMSDAELLAILAKNGRGKFGIQ